MTVHEAQILVDRLHVIAEQARQRSTHATREAILKLAGDVARMAEAGPPTTAVPSSPGEMPR